MNINYKMIDDYIAQLNEEIDELSVSLDQLHNNMVNAEMELKEASLKVEDIKKIQNIEHESNNTDAVFSPHSRHEFIEVDSSDVNLDILLKNEANAKEKYESAEMIFDSVSNRVREKIDFISYLETLKKDIKMQIAEYSNEAFITELKEVTQKKRLINLDKSKFDTIVAKSRSTYIDPSRDALKEMMTGINFIEADLVRAKQILTQNHKDLEEIVNKSDSMLNRFLNNEPDKTLLNGLNEYIGEMTHIYPDIKFKITVSNIKPIDMIDSNMNRCLLGFLKGLVNSFILKCNPKEISLKLLYDDGYLTVTGDITGKYINFYQEITDAPNSIVANMYEKVFLLNGVVNFMNKKDGSFSVYSKIPVKNYL